MRRSFMLMLLLPALNCSAVHCLAQKSHVGWALAAFLSERSRRPRARLSDALATTQVVVLETQTARKSTAQILELHGIPADRSQDLQAEL